MSRQPEDLARRIQRRCLEAAESAYESAGFGGLCEEGRWECALQAVRALDLEELIGGASQAPVAGEPKVPASGGKEGSRDSWSRRGIGDEAFAALAEELPASELWSLLLEVMRRRAEGRGPAEVQRQWQRDGFTRLAPVDQRTLVELDGHLLAAARVFEAVELSPLAPLGACSAVGLASQNKVVSALRGTEVVSDPTNVLALECAVRLRADPARVVRLATCQRCVRAQAVPKQSGFARHFRMFCLATAGRERRDHGLLLAALREQVGTLLDALDRLEAHGYAFPARRFAILATGERAALADRLAAGVEGVEVERKPLDHPYYDGLRFLLYVRNAEGDDVPLADGGAFDWLGKLAANRKLVFVASGLGSQLAAALFRRREV